MTNNLLKNLFGSAAAVATDTVSEKTLNAGVTVEGIKFEDGAILLDTNVEEITTEVELTADEIVGTDAGDVGHTAGAILVAAPSSDYALEFVKAVLIYDYDTAAYTGGADDLVVRVGTVAQSSTVSAANCLGASGDKVYKVNALATETSLSVGSTINLFGTAYTQPGTAAGTLRVQLTYRIHTTGL